jgi:hypothetical protein
MTKAAQREYDVIAPSGRMHRFRRKTVADHLRFAGAVMVNLALWGVILWPVVQWLVR